jgi:hypothetical protein
MKGQASVTAERQLRGLHATPPTQVDLVLSGSDATLLRKCFCSHVFREGDRAFLLSIRWLLIFEKLGPNNVTPIDNRAMEHFADQLIEGVDYITLPLSIWNFLVHKYQIVGPIMERPVLLDRSRKPKVEIYPLRITYMTDYYHTVTATMQVSPSLTWRLWLHYYGIHVIPAHRLHIYLVNNTLETLVLLTPEQHGQSFRECGITINVSVVVTSNSLEYHYDDLKRRSAPNAVSESCRNALICLIGIHTRRAKESVLPRDVVLKMIVPCIWQSRGRDSAHWLKYHPQFQTTAIDLQPQFAVLSPRLKKARLDSNDSLHLGLSEEMLLPLGFDSDPEF